MRPTNLDVAMTVEKDVVAFDVAVDDVLGVEVLKSSRGLDHS